MTTKQLVIVNSSLQEKLLVKYLRKSNCDIRVSDTSVKNSCIFSSCAIVFLIFDSCALETNQQSNDHDEADSFLQTLRKLVRIHRNAYVIIVQYNESFAVCMKKVIAIQQRIFPSIVKILVARDEEQATSYMVSLATDHSKTARDVIRSEIGRRIADHVDEEGICANVLESIGVHRDNTTMLMDEYGSLGAIVESAVSGMAADEELGADNTSLAIVSKFFRS